jgi:hypothetical protein
MTKDENGRIWPRFSKGTLITSAALAGAGILMVVAGLAVGGSHVLSVTRRMVREMDVPPGDLAKLKWKQAKAAAAAGAAAWQNGTPADRASIG